MIGSSMALGIGAAATANPCLASGASVVLESLHEDRLTLRAPRRFRKRIEAAEEGTGILRIVRAPVLA